MVIDHSLFIIVWYLHKRLSNRLSIHIIVNYLRTILNGKEQREEGVLPSRIGTGHTCSSRKRGGVRLLLLLSLWFALFRSVSVSVSVSSLCLCLFSLSLSLLCASLFILSVVLPVSRLWFYLWVSYMAFILISLYSLLTYLTNFITEFLYSNG